MRLYPVNNNYKHGKIKKKKKRTRVRGFSYTRQS